MKKTTLSFIPKLSVISAALLFFSITACKKENSTEPTLNSSTKALESDENGKIIPNKYIVVLNKSTMNKSLLNSNLSYLERNTLVRNQAKIMLNSNYVSEKAIGVTFNKSIVGFSVTLTAEQAEALKNDSRVEYIENDRIVSLGKPGSGGSNPPVQTIPYGITRVGFGDGTGKTAWIIDSGVDLTHPDLNVNVTKSISFLTSGKHYTSPNDGNGHGTHVAGTIAAKNNTIGVVGVAANATVIAVRVLDAMGSGAISGVIQGVDYVASNAVAGDVANMSLGGGISVALDNAVLSAASTGILFSIAAGNSSVDANTSSPARVNGPNVFTVSAMNNTDTWASFSNFGSPVDFCAPGVNITSTWKGGLYNTISGTSMAAPHVAGILLLRGGIPAVSGYVVGDPDGTSDPIAHL